MDNIMTYSQLSAFCYDNGIEIKSLCQKIGVTPQGLAKGMKKQSLGMLTIKALCGEIKITPNRFFGIDDIQQQFNTTQLGISNTQNIGAAGIEILQQQLATKDEQIKQLLNLLNK